MKNTIFEIAMIPQTLNIKNYRTKSAKSINLHIIRKLIKYFLKKGLVKATVFVTQIISRRQKNANAKVLYPISQKQKWNSRRQFSKHCVFPNIQLKGVVNRLTPFKNVSNHTNR